MAMSLESRLERKKIDLSQGGGRLFLENGLAKALMLEFVRIIFLDFSEQF